VCAQKAVLIASYLELAIARKEFGEVSDHLEKAAWQAASVMKSEELFQGGLAGGLSCT
jgi:hypothetical protein